MGAAERSPLLRTTYRPRGRICCGRLPFNGASLAVLSAGFALIFLAYNTLQNYVTSLLPGHLGSNSLAVVYAVAAASAFAAPVVVDRVGDKGTMVVGGVGYVIYLASLVHILRVTVLTASVFVGFGAAILWVGFGVYISKLGRGRGHYIGIFWSVFQLSNVVGNLGGYIVFKDVSNSPWFYAVFAIIAAGGVLLLLCFLRPVPQERQHKASNVLDATGPTTPQARGSDADLMAIRIRVEPNRRTIKSICRQTWHMLTSRSILLLLPMFFWTGFELSFWTGSFTKLLHADVIGLVMGFTGIGEVVTGWVLGRLADRCGRSVGLFMGCAVYGVALALTQAMRMSPGPDWAHSGPIAHASWAAFAAALCYGVGDSAFNTQTYALLSDRLPDAHSFTLFNLAQNVGSAVGFYYAEALPLTGNHGSPVQLIVQAAVMVAATAGAVTVDRSAPLRVRMRGRDIVV